MNNPSIAKMSRFVCNRISESTAQGIVSGKTFAQNNIVEADTVLDSVSIHVVADERNARTQQKTEQMERDREVIRELLTRLKK